MKKLLFLLLALLLLTGCKNNTTKDGNREPGEEIEEEQCYKPVIYLYPERETEVSVKLGFEENLTCAYPAYEEGWKVLAKPDGTLRDLKDGGSYPYLFWEGPVSFDPDFSRGFVVRGKDTAKFLERALGKKGLREKEIREFVVFWLPHLEKNPYNLIAFQGENYERAASLSVNPSPDTVLRVYMAFAPLKEPVDLPEQVLTAAPRRGFTLVEWGGGKYRYER